METERRSRRLRAMAGCCGRPEGRPTLDVEGWLIGSSMRPWASRNRDQNRTVAGVHSRSTSARGCLGGIQLGRLLWRLGAAVCRTIPPIGSLVQAYPWGASATGMSGALYWRWIFRGCIRPSPGRASSPNAGVHPIHASPMLRWLWQRA